MTVVNKRSSDRFILISILVLIMIAGSFFVGVAVGAEQRSVDKITDLENKEKLDMVDFSLFWDVWLTLEDKHINGRNVSVEERVWNAIKGLTYAYEDPNTVFMPPQEFESFKSEISGQFEGVGMEVGERDGVLTVISPLKGTPAYRAGIEAGDKILKIDGKLTEGMGVAEAVRLIRGEKGTNVVLNILRDDVSDSFDISITRGVIDVPTVETEMRDDGIFVIKLFNFAGQSISKFENAMVEFERSGADKLILDLRNNPGGYLLASVEVASYFLPSGEVVLKEKFSDQEEPVVYRSKGYGDGYKNIEIVVMINQGSASASEIVAGALSDHGVATTVGSRSFGKGSVQEVVDITSDTSLKVTIAEWLTPNDISFEGEGIEPEVEVEMTRDDVEKNLDPQFERAIEILLKK